MNWISSIRFKCFFISTSALCLCVCFFCLCFFTPPGNQRKPSNVNVDRIKSDYSSANHNNCQFVKICLFFFTQHANFEQNYTFYNEITHENGIISDSSPEKKRKLCVKFGFYTHTHTHVKKLKCLTAHAHNCFSIVVLIVEYIAWIPKNIYQF